MVRSYALTIGAVAFRQWLLVLTGAGVPEFAAYATAAWFAWVPNLIVAELFLRTRGRPGGRVTRRFDRCACG